MYLLGRPDSMSTSRRVAMLCRFVKKRGYYATVVIAAVALLALSLPAPVEASGIGISGSFQQHYYKMRLPKKSPSRCNQGILKKLNI